MALMSKIALKGQELDPKQRTLLFRQLAQSERAGLTVLDSIRILLESADPLLRQRLSVFRKQLAANAPISRAGLRSGIFLPWEERLIQAAEISGKLADSYSALARRHADRALRRRNLWRGMTFPLVLFALAILVSPLPALLFGNIGPGRFLLDTVGRLMLFFGSLYLLTWSWRRLGATGADNTLFRLLLRIPWFGKLIRRQQQYNYLSSLALLLDAGVPAFDALGIAADSVSHPTLRTQFAQAEEAVRSGSGVTEALAFSDTLGDEEAINLVRSGEFSGRLSEMLHHVARQLNEQQNSQFKSLTDWAPKLAYAAIVILFLLE